ncbi:hypothetical protein ACH492_36915 [Streptomyces sp. NPDC019443]|uniref:hypothetical protein n=1 Tax=Streptomyces sp. NPDC019443 TaxID=3365061 RepID=UPI0037900BF9
MLDPYAEPGHRGIFHRGDVWIEDAQGTVLARREHARAAFSSVRHQLWWDRLDLLYFAGSALWTYVSLPFVLADEAYDVEELEPWSEHDKMWRRLRVCFPGEIHTHCREQILYLDERGLIRRHDYTAELFGNWAKAAHYCHDHRDFGGLVIPTRRVVFPRRPDNRPRPGPVLVHIAFAGAKLTA